MCVYSKSCIRITLKILCKLSTHLSLRHSRILMACALCPVACVSCGVRCTQPIYTTIYVHNKLINKFASDLLMPCIQHSQWWMVNLVKMPAWPHTIAAMMMVCDGDCCRSHLPCVCRRACTPKTHQFLCCVERGSEKESCRCWLTYITTHAHVYTSIYTDWEQ